MNSDMTNRIIERCIDFTNAEINRISLSLLKPQITHMVSKTAYECKR